MRVLAQKHEYTHSTILFCHQLNTEPIMDYNNMQRYANLGGDSGVVGYVEDGTAIAVQFRDRSIYLYNAAAPGPHAVSTMIQLAHRGEGLNSYISRYVNKNYASRLR